MRASDPTLRALHRLMTDAARGGQAKVDALIAISQRTVFLAQWPGHRGFRTLTNSSRESALPVFTSRDELEVAARRFAWHAPDGSVAFEEAGARHAFNHALAHDLAFVVFDAGSPHSIEASRDEIEPLLSPAARRDSTGPYAGTGRVSSSMLERVRPSSAPSLDAGAAALPNLRPPRVPGGFVSEPPLVQASPNTLPPAAVAANFGSGGSLGLGPASIPPTDDLLECLASILREYPECEWGVFCTAARGPAPPMPAVGLRLDPNYRARAQEIAERLRDQARLRGTMLDVLLLDEPELARRARADGVPFFPWRR